MHFFQAARAVVAHAGHDDAECVGASKLGYGAEKYINRWLVPIDQRAIGNFDNVLRAVTLEHHVFAAGGDQGKAGMHPVAVLRFADLYLAQAVEAFGEHCGEYGRHVLDDDDTETVGRQSRENGFQRLGAAGGGADGDDLIGGSGERRVVRGAEHHVGSKVGAAAWRRAQCTHVGFGGAAHGLNDIVGGIFKKRLQTELGLGDDRSGTGSQRLEGGLRAFFGQRRADDHRRRAFGHYFLEEGNAIHARHFNIDDQYVGPDRTHPLQRKERVGGGTDHFDAGVGGQRLRDDLAYDSGVVDDHYLDFIGHSYS